MILDRHYTPGDGQAEVEICGCPYHGLVQLEHFAGTAINGGSPLQVGVAYQLGVSLAAPAGITQVQSLNLSPAFSYGAWGSNDFQVWFDAAAGLIQPRDVGLFPAVVTATFDAPRATLPNGEKISMKLPSNGDTYKLKSPGVNAVSRTSEQQASDTAKGYTWQDFLTVSGGNQQIYGGHDLGPRGWIYSAPDGKKWKIQLTNTANTTGNSAVFEFQITPFGRYPATVFATTQNVVLSDIGQSTPVVTFTSHTWEYGERNCTVDELRIDLDDVSADGGKAVFGLRSLCPYSVGASSLSSPEWAILDAIPMGFLLVTISNASPTPQVAVTVLYDRTATIGTVSSIGTSEVISGKKLAVWFDDAGAAVPVEIYRVIASDFQALAVNVTDTKTAIGEHVWRFTWGATVAEFKMPCMKTRTDTYTGGVETGTSAGSSTYNLDGKISGGATRGTAISIPAYVEVHSMNSDFWQGSWADGLECSHKQSAPLGGRIRSVADGAGSGSTYYGDSAVWAIKRISNRYFGFLAMRCDNSVALVTGNNTTDGPYVYQDTQDMVWIGGFTKAGKDTLGGNLGIQPNYIPSGTVHPLTNIPHLQANGSVCCFV